MEITHNNMIPGVVNKGVEYFGIKENVVKAFHNGGLYNFHDMPKFTFDVIRRLMDKADATMEEMQAFAFERWGGLDPNPDIDENGIPSDPEYVPSGSKAYFDCGKQISDAQMRVLKLIRLENKAIADKLFTSPYTVCRHVQDMLSNSGFNNRTSLALWAKDKGII